MWTSSIIYRFLYQTSDWWGGLDGWKSFVWYNLQRRVDHKTDGNFTLKVTLYCKCLWKCWIWFVLFLKCHVCPTANKRFPQTWSPKRFTIVSWGHSKSTDSSVSYHDANSSFWKTWRKNITLHCSRHFTLTGADTVNDNNDKNLCVIRWRQTLLYIKPSPPSVA